MNQQAILFGNEFRMYKGIIITYNPDLTAKKHITALINQKINLIIVDNGSPGISDITDIAGDISNESVILIKLQKNYGLAYAQNRGIEEAIEQKANFIFLLDQDSELPDNYFSSMIAFYEKWEDHSNIGLIAPNFYDPNIKILTRYAKLTRFFYKHIECGHDTVKEVSFVVASGSLLPVNVLQKIGFMREDFFIDHIDSEFSLRLLRNGYKILVNCNVIMNHSIGERTLHKLFGLTIKPNHHGAFRKYYIFRNGCRLVWEYGWKYPGFAIMMLNRLIHDILGIVFFEKNKFAKLAAVVNGFSASFFSFAKVKF